MNWLKQWFVRRGMYDDLAAEMQQHLEEKIDALVASGVPGKEAEQQARREFGNVLAMEEQSREEWRWPTLESVLGDIRFAVRQLRKAPGFATVAVLTLALGVGATTAVFSLFDKVVLHPLPYKDAERLLLITETAPKLGSDEIGVSAQEAGDYRERSQGFAETAAFEKDGFNLTGAERAMRVNAARISASTFSVLQAPPMQGRPFTTDEEKEGSNHVAVISWSLWRNLYHSDPQVLGKALRLDESPYTIVGVMPPAFQFPFDGEPQSERADLWVPLTFSRQELAPGNRIQSFGVGLIARVRPRIKVEEANAGFVQIARAFQDEHPDVYKEIPIAAHVYGFGGQVVRNARPVVMLLIGAVLCVLLIACANVANLLLARANHRGREMALRAALGAGRIRLLRQCLVESLVLSVTSAVFGLLLAEGIVVNLRHWGPATLPALQQVALNPVALLFTLGVSLLTSVLFGFVPAWRLSHVAPQASLKITHQTGAGRGTQRVQDALVVCEVALAVVLLIGGALMFRSFLRLLSTPFGFDPQGVTIVRTLFDRTRYPEASRRDAVQREILVRLAQLPGTTKAAATSHLPLADERQIGFRLEHAGPNEYHWARNALTTPGYFSAMGIPLVRGRDFDERDERRSSPTAIVSQRFVREFLHDEDAIGKRFEWGERGPITIVGVAGDVHAAALDSDPPPVIYQPMFQGESGASGRMAIILRTAGPAAPFKEVQRAVASLDAGLPLYNVTSLEQIVSESLAQRRFTVTLLGGFALVAVTLAMIGVFGVLSYLVGSREREIGVRMALGADRSRILGMVLRRGLGLGSLGCAAGLLLSAATTDLLRASLYQVSRFDPLTLVLVPLLSLVVTGLAVMAPALRAASIEPMQALRAE